MRNGLRTSLMLLVFMAASAATYFYAIADVPHRDQIHFMLERPYFENGWEWFQHSLSWSRTRFLWPGDSYLFRPLLMAVLALKDIFLRGNVYAAGAVNIALMGLTGFSLYLFSRRLLPALYAVAVALLFVVQHAGVETVAWGHISPYLMSLAFFGFALNEILKARHMGRSRLVWAGAFLLAGSLAHEIVIVTVALAAAALAASYMLRRQEDAADEVARGDYLIRAAGIPLAAYTALYLVDYVSHGAPQKFDPLFHGFSGLFSSLITAPGAALVAFAAPFTLRFTQTQEDMLSWDFGGMMTTVQWAGLVLCAALAAGLYLSMRTIRKRGISALNLTALMAMLMLCAYIIGVGYARIYLRDVAYYYGATYYYAFSGYVFCLLIAMGLHRLRKGSEGSPLRRRAGYAALALIVALAALNYSKDPGTLRFMWDDGYSTAGLQLRLERSLAENGGKYCLDGFTPDAGLAAKGLQGLLLRDRFCGTGDPRTPAYITPDEKGELWLASLRRYAVGMSEAARMVQTEPAGSKFGILEDANIPGTRIRGLGGESQTVMSINEYERPDLAVTVTDSDYTAVVLGYRDSRNYMAFVMEGPLVYGRAVANGRPGPLMYRNALPTVKPSYRLEVRHSGGLVYLFVDDYLLTSMPSSLERAGRVGLYVQGSRWKEASFEHFVAEPSAMGTPLIFTREIKIP